MPTRTRQGIPEFTKENVIELLKQVEVPTVTNKDHGAEWWNETFGQVIKHSFSTSINTLVEQVERMWEME